MLSDVSTEFAGNLCVYPRSHHVLEKYFQQNGFDEAIEKGLEGLPGLPVGAAKQIIAKPGDVVLCHYQLAHSIAPNITSNIRYALYFRVSILSALLSPRDRHNGLEVIPFTGSLNR